MRDQHSPGPWELNWNPVPGFTTHESFPDLHYVAIRSANYWDVAPHGLHVSGYLRKADIFLIAAAPDLLEQLRKVRDWMDDPVLNMRCPFDVPLASAIREAIAKAEAKS